MKTLGLSAVAIGAALVCAALPLSFQWPPSKVLSISVDQAEARVGRPATATSVAGVNRRMVRRGDRRAAAVGAAAAGAAAVGVAAAYATGPGYVGPAPYARYAGPASYYGGPVVDGYGPGDAVVVNPVTGRWCRTESNGYQWCWTP